MKKLLLIAMLATASYIVQAQTKGTNAMGLGLNFNTARIETASSKSESKHAGFNIGYGYFLKENEKIGMNVFYSMYNSGSIIGAGEPDPNGWKTNSFGGAFTYQKFYALIKKFYAHAGPRAGYNYSQGTISSNDQRINTYSVGVNGGVSWFFSKRFALEADLLAADLSYSKSKESSANSDFKYTSTGLQLNSTGAFNGLGFKINFLF